MARFSSFNAPFSQMGAVIITWSKQSVGVATDAMKIAARAGDEAAVRATPVDTGKARSNWFVTVDAPIDIQLPPYVPYPKTSQAAGAGIAETANASAAIAQGDAAVAGFDAAGNKTIYVQNSAEHIERLENGWSLQQPGSMLDIGLQAAKIAAEQFLASV